MPHDIFISYSTKDKHIADAICSRLENNRIRCWIAPRDILPGETWGNAIINGINHSKIVVVVFSSHSNSSGQVINEIERSVSKGKIIIPVRIEDITPTGDMELFLARRHWLDAITPPMETHIARLGNTIFNLLGLQSIPTSEEEPGKRIIGADIKKPEPIEMKPDKLVGEPVKNNQPDAVVQTPLIGSLRVISNSTEISEEPSLKIGDIRLIPK